MKIHQHRNNIITILLLVLILSLPLASLRIPLAETSISIVSLIAILLCVTLLLPFLLRQQRLHISHGRVVWYLGALCAAAFLPTLLHSPSSHAYGVVIEWLLLPFCTAFCIVHCTPDPKKTARAITIGLTLLLTILVIDACTAFCTGALTFDHRLQGHFYTSPNQLAMLLAPILILLITLRATMHRHKHILTLLIIGAITTLIATQSLSGLLAFGAAVTLWYALTRARTRHTILIAGTLLAVLFVGAIGIKSLNSPFFHTHSSLTSRLVIWDAAVFLIRESPFYGHAIDDFQRTYLAAQPFFPPYHDWAVPTPHNLALTLLFSGGLLALTVYFFLFAHIIFLGIRYHHHTSALAPALALILIIMIGCTDTPLWGVDLGHLFWLMVALLLLAVQQKNTL